MQVDSKISDTLSESPVIIDENATKSIDELRVSTEFGYGSTGDIPASG
jgi:hypothetical protein